jgi:hypothetical protein
MLITYLAVKCKVVLCHEDVGRGVTPTFLTLPLDGMSGQFHVQAILPL